MPIIRIEIDVDVNPTLWDPWEVVDALLDEEKAPSFVAGETFSIGGHECKYVSAEWA